MYLFSMTVLVEAVVFFSVFHMAHTFTSVCHLNLRLQLPHHVEDGHDQDEGGGRHGEDQS